MGLNIHIVTNCVHTLLAFQQLQLYDSVGNNSLGSVPPSPCVCQTQDPHTQCTIGHFAPLLVPLTVIRLQKLFPDKVYLILLTMLYHLATA